MQRFMLVFTLFSFCFALTTQATSWKIDPTHSSVGFSVRHLVISNVKGLFKDYSGSISFEPAKLQDGTAEMTVQVTSVDTGEKDRDNHLRSADFFDVEKFPVMTFKSTMIHDVQGEKFMLMGNLTIKGVTKEVMFDCHLNGVITDPMGGTRAGFSAATTINRQDYGVLWSKTLDGGGLVVGDDVTITLELELIKN